MSFDRHAVEDALRTVQDPDIHKDLVTLGMVKHIAVAGESVRLVIELTTPACPMKDKIRTDVEAAVHAKAKACGTTLEMLEIEFTADVRKANEKVGGSCDMKASLIDSDEEVVAFSHGDQARLDPKCARALGEAIRDRFIRIYKNWYESAGIGAFVPAQPSES